jgi:DNA-binding NarL/FixJ family response regulator
VKPLGHDPVASLLMERSLGHVAAAEADVAAAVSHLEAAAAMHAQVPIPIERGRTLLALGALLRRRKQRRAARDALAEAVGIFEAVGSPIWEARARAELARISGRAPGGSDLTETERRVAELVAQGRTNREVAAELVVTVRAVESTLTKVYGTLGVRSRSQLAALVRDAESH